MGSIIGSVVMEYGVVNRRICIVIKINSAALEVACPAPGFGAKKVQESSRDQLGTALT
jgi:hypothetical protein